MLIAALTFFTSCSKDNEVGNEIPQENIIGIWQVSAGEADVFIKGELLADIKMKTAGTMEFKTMEVVR